MSDEQTEHSPTDRGAPTPWARVVRELRDQARDRGISGAEVLELLGVRKQDLANWSSSEGSWKREPPLWAIRRLLGRLDLVAIIAPDEIVLVPRSEILDEG